MMCDNKCKCGKEWTVGINLMGDMVEMCENCRVIKMEDFPDPPPLDKDAG